MIAPSCPQMVLPIEQLKADEQASIVEMTGQDREVHRLAEIGLRVGASVRMVRPGTPCLLAIDGKRLSVRLNGSVDVLVSASTA